MRAIKRSGAPALLALAVGTACLSRATGTAADAGSPTPIAVTPSPVLVAATPETEPTYLPTVAPERSTSVVPTQVPPADQAPTEAPPPTTVPATATTVRMQPTEPPAVRRPTTAATSTVQSGIYAPLPSAADLRLDARLRWGTHVPASVRRWAYLIVPAARRYHVDPNLVAAVMTMESNGDPTAWSGADARGLMQVLHGPWDPRANVNDGVRMLAGLWDRYHDLSLVLAAYNAGPNAVDAYNGVPPYRETRDYVIIVTYLYDLFGHHHLTSERKAIFRASLHDLRHFKDQTRRVQALARIAHLRHDPVLLCTTICSSQAVSPAEKPFVTHDPFWPIGDRPDPLQRVDPYAVS